MRTVVAVWPLAAKMLMDCENFMLAALNFRKVDILWNFYLYYTNCSFKCTFEPCKGVFRDKPLIIAVLYNFQFAEILNSQET